MLKEELSNKQKHYRNLSTPEIREKLQKIVENISEYKEKQQNIFNPRKKEEIFPLKRTQEHFTPEEEQEIASFKTKQSVELGKTVRKLEKEQGILENILSERIKPYINISPEKIEKALENSANKILTEKQANAVDIIQILYSPTDIEQGVILRLKNEKEEESKASTSRQSHLELFPAIT